jgi:manganese efflux pump family protein
MDTLTLIGIALGLAMDALAVAVVTGVVLGDVTGRQTFRLAWHFGLFQFLMPVVGWAAGITLEQWIAAGDRWLAFGLLAAIGGKMVYGGATGREEAAVRDPTRGLSLVALSVATSIDALAVGLSLGVLRVRIWYPAAVIGATALVLTAVGIRLGPRIGVRFGGKAEILGGAILIGIGVRILVRHLAAP